MVGDCSRRNAFHFQIISNMAAGNEANGQTTIDLNTGANGALTRGTHDIDISRRLGYKGFLASLILR